MRRCFLHCVVLTATIFLFLSASLVEAQLTAENRAGNLTRTDSREKEKWGCVLCTFITGLVSQLRQLHGVSANEALSKFCDFFGSPKSLMCRLASVILFRKALSLIDANNTPDVVCRTLSYCKDPKCHIFPLGNATVSVKSLRKIHHLERVKAKDLCDQLPMLCPVRRGLRPAYDEDGDLFSTYPTKRGSDWRGRDCDDRDPKVYPGRNTTDAFRDENCNGIFGVDNVTGKTYEELWCLNSSPMGVIALGDSVTAHFGVPADFLEVRSLSTAGFADIMDIIANDFDWPMLSGITGFANVSDYRPNRGGFMKSVYSELLKRNKCNHRDYQNIGVNGALVRELSGMLDFVARNRTTSVKPALIFFSMIGNDVCSPPPRATTPQQYYRGLTKALEKAETIFPAGSHVLVVPLVDGRILYNTMHNRTHPIGSFQNDVTYSDFYDYLNCLGISPCWGWMNTNETVRNATWKLAQTLNAQIPRILKESATKFKNIKVHVLDDVYSGVLSSFNGSKWELLEPVDGFHPSQLANALLGEYMFKKTVELGIIPPANPFNDLIENRFGDQGGH
ncbi:putative GPI inositol deacylase precursor [Trypanosoma cruzi]|uniref:GPI inositol deacylase, putative n=2 Tax=Trypanosoma cruzi TaxID=5693 RepID=Q4D5N4_TRYCC|nr:GPI inositol deacylase precursor, putative [Trypanosoma cruzi]EAN87831.1 GPI inositol deacylase precursor, putative [Trypanosoma cruzi]PWV20197.1 putative GPI inositol deacylase precursor [Trypanosoma cruzi]RNC60265.1 putative GPI inositol deacylase precursor [Trypanosoma cruzi]|eukprot:XP_809682.1 GPI inositol deacylase precursor [Trypanosoma cruzi strain CL Brener]